MQVGFQLDIKIFPLISNSLKCTWNKSFNDITLSGGAAHTFTWNFPISFSTVYYVNVASAQNFTGSGGAGSAVISSIGFYNTVSLDWYIKNNATNGKAYSKAQFQIALGI